ncbi:MAG TPA: M1 family metallopeptidase [Oculatellaceae cyanobacterium]
MKLRKICSSLCLLSMLTSITSSQPSSAKGSDTVAAVVSASANSKPVEQDSVRLPLYVRPTNYALTFEPDAKSFTFKGTANINITISAQTSVIVLNAADLTISDASIRTPRDGLQNATVQLDAAKEQAQLSFKSQLAPGQYVLNLRFKGSLNDQLRGFYRSAYVDEKGATKYMFVTQMEPTDARRMFPCFDEPAFKSTFQITAVVDPQYTVISNAPVAKTERQGNGKKIVAFDKTPVMSSYLVALIVGDLKASQTKTANGIPITVWTTPGKESLAECALNTAVEILPVQEKYFGIPYPGKKLDLIALPDFGAGAMENLGAITFRESRLLLDSKTGTNFLKRVIAGIEAHEMAHQWFGDLVTMQWWDDLWLNEAFATWMATKTVNTIRPEWRALARSVETRNFAMGDDQLQSTRPIHAHVANPSDAIEMFDGITYEKGASILRMLEVFVGEETFQKGIHDYLSSHAFGNAKTEELWGAIATASGGNVSVLELMKPWVYQPGFPLLSITQQSPDREIKLEQKRFFAASDAPNSKTLWQIPISFHPLQSQLQSSQTQSVSTAAATSTAVEQRVQTKLLTEAQGGLEAGDLKNVAFANKDGSGFYRVMYAQQDFQTICAKFAQLSAEERLSFISDTHALAVSGKIPVENLLNLLLKVKDENDPLVLLNLVRLFDLPYPSMNAESMPAYQRFVQVHLSPLKDRLGWDAKDGEPELNKDLRSEVLTQLGTYGQDKKTIEEAFEKYRRYMQDSKSVSPDVVTAMLTAVAFNGSDAEYDEMIAAWKSAKAPEDEKRFLQSLTHFRKPDIVSKVLALIVSGQIRSQDAPSILGSLIEHFDTQHQAWEFTKANWTRLVKQFPPTSMRHVAGACMYFHRKSDEQELKSFFATHKVPFGESTLARALEDVHINVLYEERYANRVRQWIANHDASSPKQ